MLDIFTIGGAAIDPIATDLLPVRFNERFGAIPTLTLQRRGIALPALPDPWVGQTVTWANGGTAYFSGDVVSANPHFDQRIGWILTYQCLGLRNRLDWFPHTDSATGTYSTSFNLTLEDPSYNPARAGRSVGEILSAILTMPANAATLNGYGIGGYTGLPNTPALPSDTVNDLAALTVIPPRPVYFIGEKFGGALDAFLDQWAPNFLWRIDPQTGHIRFLDARAFPQQTLTMGQDPIEPTELARDTADCFQRVVVRGQPVAVMALLKLSRGDLVENFAWGSFTSAQAKAHWNPSQFKSPGAAQDIGSCSCPSTTTITVTSSNPAQSWTAGYWDQSHNQGTINLSSTSITDYTQFWSARIVNCPALSPGGSCTLTIDNPLPALGYDHYTITGLNTNTGSVVWRQYQIANPALWPRVTNQSTYPQAFVNPGGDAGMLTSTPMSQVLWSLNGSPPYLSFPLPFSTNATTATGNILFVAPTWSVANNAPPADVWVLLPIQTNPNTAIDPTNDATGNPTYTGTSNTIDGWTKTLTVDLLSYWRDPSLLPQVQAYASDLLDSVKDTVLEGAVVYYGLYAPALTPGLALNVVGKLGTITYPTMGWDTASDLAIREVTVEWPQTEGMAYKTTIRVSNRRRHFQAEAFLHPERRFLPIGASSLYEANAAFSSMYRPFGIGDLLNAATDLEALAPDLASTVPNPAGFAPPDLALYGPGDLARFNPMAGFAPGGDEGLEAMHLLVGAGFFAQGLLGIGQAVSQHRQNRSAQRRKRLTALSQRKAARKARARQKPKLNARNSAMARRTAEIIAAQQGSATDSHEPGELMAPIMATQQDPEADSHYESQPTLVQYSQASTNDRAVPSGSSTSDGSGSESVTPTPYGTGTGTAIGSGATLGNVGLADNAIGGILAAEGFEAPPEEPHDVLELSENPNHPPLEDGAALLKSGAPGSFPASNADLNNRSFEAPNTSTDLTAIPAARIKAMQAMQPQGLAYMQPADGGQYAYVADVTPDGGFYMLVLQAYELRPGSSDLGSPPVRRWLSMIEPVESYHYYAVVYQDRSPPSRSGTVDLANELAKLRTPQIANMYINIAAGLDDASKKAFLAGALTFALHLTPGGATADNLAQGEWSEMGISLAGDLAFFLGGPLAKFVGEAGRVGRGLRAGAAGLELAVGSIRAGQGVFALYNGEGQKAAGYLGEATLQLLGVSAEVIRRLNAKLAQPGKALVKTNEFSGFKRLDDEGDELVAGAKAGNTADIPKGKLFYEPKITGDPNMPAGKGRTDRFGNITYSAAGTAEDQALVLAHEKVHSLLSPKFKLLRKSRADVRRSAYKKSQFMKCLEEAIAETTAQLKVNGIKGLPEGLASPVARGYVTLSRVIKEGAIGTVTVGGVTYAAYVVSSKFNKSD